MHGFDFDIVVDWFTDVMHSFNYGFFGAFDLDEVGWVATGVVVDGVVPTAQVPIPNVGCGAPKKT